MKISRGGVEEAGLILDDEELDEVVGGLSMRTMYDPFSGTHNY